MRDRKERTTEWRRGYEEMVYNNRCEQWFQPVKKYKVNSFDYTGIWTVTKIAYTLMQMSQTLW